jgi:hypothetical protein
LTNFGLRDYGSRTSILTSIVKPSYTHGKNLEACVDVAMTCNLSLCSCQMATGQSWISENCATIASIRIIPGEIERPAFLGLQLGMTKVDAPALRQRLLQVAVSEQAQVGELDRYGQRYTLEFELRKGMRKVVVRSGWIILSNETVPRLTTCFVKKRKR